MLVHTSFVLRVMRGKWILCSSSTVAGLSHGLLSSGLLAAAAGCGGWWARRSGCLRVAAANLYVRQHCLHYMEARCHTGIADLSHQKAADNINLALLRAA